MSTRFFIIPFIGLALFGCSKIDEEVKPGLSDHKTLTLENLQTDLPKLNLVVNQQQFDSMYANYYEPIELNARLSVYRNNALVVAEEVVKIETKGSHTLKYPLKSIGITFDNSYNNADRSLLNPISILPFHNLDKIKACRLRNSGNDFLNTNFKDLCYNQLAIDAGLDIDLTYGEQMVVFVNGHFHGVMNLQSEGNSKGIAKLYNTVADNVDLAKIDNPGTITFKTGDPQRLDSYITAIEEKNLQFVLANTDIPHFIDYIIFQSFVANNDWPYNNVRFYSIDGRPFRFVMYDLDWCNTLDLNKEPMYFIDPPKENIVTNLFLLLYSNENFKNQYDARYQEILQLPALDPFHFNQRVDFFSSRIKEVIIYQIQAYHAPESMVDWYQEIDLLKQHYQKRYNHFF